MLFTLMVSRQHLAVIFPLFCPWRVITSATAANEAQVVESGHLVLDGGRGVAKLSRVILIVARHHRYQGAIGDVAQGNHLVTCQEKVKEKVWILNLEPD